MQSVTNLTPFTSFRTTRALVFVTLGHEL